MAATQKPLASCARACVCVCARDDRPHQGHGGPPLTDKESEAQKGEAVCPDTPLCGTTGPVAPAVSVWCFLSLRCPHRSGSGSGCPVSLSPRFSDSPTCSCLFLSFHLPEPLPRPQVFRTRDGGWGERGIAGPTPHPNQGRGKRRTLHPGPFPVPLTQVPRRGIRV